MLPIAIRISFVYFSMTLNLFSTSLFFSSRSVDMANTASLFITEHRNAPFALIASAYLSNNVLLTQKLSRLGFFEHFAPALSQCSRLT